MSTPDVSVVVPSHDRERRLSILLDALAEQTLDPSSWEVLVVHTYPPAVAARVLDGHPLSVRRTLRHQALAGQRAAPSVQRNVGWRIARAPLVAFTDDDCRPDPEWLERLLSAYRAAPGSVVQGTTLPDPLDGAFDAPHVRTLAVHDPPGRFMQTCNILYERELLDRLEGFDERFPAAAGEDVDLGLRAKTAGAPLTGAPAAVVYHAVEPLTVLQKIRANRKWEHLAYLVKRHPQLRRECCLRVWWKPEHFRAVIALAGLVAAARRPWMALSVIPYYRLERFRYGHGRRARLRAIRRLPELWLIELAEILVFVRGSIRYRTLLL